MMDENSKKKKSSNKTQIIIHKMPLFERIFGIFSSVFLTSIPIACLCMGFENKLGMIVLLFSMLLFCLLMYLNVFKTYICFDVVDNKIIIRDGFKKEEFSTKKLINISVVNDCMYPKLFSLDFNFVDQMKKDYSWSSGPSSRVLFSSKQSQRKRLEKFCEECNQYLSNQ